MKKLPIIATMLLCMGILLFPACDEKKGTNPLVLAALVDSKYYLEFDADYNNDGTVDEHVKMRLQYPFDHISYDNWYQGIFNNDKYDVSINIPDTIIGPTTYNAGDTNFFIKYSINYSESYSSYSGHVFSFNIIQWEGIGGEVYAKFGGELSNSFSGATIIVSNGKVFSRIQE